MTQKITKADLQGMLGRLERNLKRHRLIITGDVLTLTTGSKLYGNSYQVEAIRYGSVCAVQPHRPRQPFGTLHFGFTARDCYDRMHALCVAYETLPARQMPTRPGRRAGQSLSAALAGSPGGPGGAAGACRVGPRAPLHPEG